jgi:hypothetical protein
MVVLVAVLVLVTIGVAIASTIYYRDYLGLYAAAHHDIAPLVAWVFQRDADPEVETSRRLAIGVGVVALLCFLVLGVALQFVVRS